MVLAYSQMHEWDGWWMLVAAGWLLIWGLVVWWVVSLVRARDGGRNDHGATAREVLDRRLAEGEISVEEYQRLREAMRRPTRRAALRS
jgi:putative membrane protein